MNPGSNHWGDKAEPVVGLSITLFQFFDGGERLAGTDLSICTEARFVGGRYRLFLLPPRGSLPCPAEQLRVHISKP